MDISCKKINCVYNRGMHCHASSIIIGSDLDCKTFLRDDKLLSKAKTSNQSMFEVASLEKDVVNEDVHIDCKASKCLFNREGTCVANGISVLSSRKSAFCTTNIKK
ncbi:MAG: DUF1540 domain-containing protein [Clostridia bacterium]|nr:DUF1540 domain-containing protein [Clostridia bacterium]